MHGGFPPQGPGRIPRGPESFRFSPAGRTRLTRGVSDAYDLARSLLFRLDAETADHLSLQGLRLAERR